MLHVSHFWIGLWYLKMLELYCRKSLPPLKRSFQTSEDKFLCMKEMKQKLKLNLSTLLARVRMRKDPVLRPVHL